MSLAFLTGCESWGWSWGAFSETFTPGVHADTSVRTWDENGKPHVEEVQSDPAFLYDAEAQRAQK